MIYILAFSSLLLLRIAAIHFDSKEYTDKVKEIRIRVRS
jgi:hypothetical protein